MRDPVLEEAALMEAWSRDVDIDRAATLRREATRWRLLLRLDSDPPRGLEWPGGGAVNFCVPGGALRAGAADRVRAFTGAPCAHAAA
jgi:hypothetical protein